MTRICRRRRTGISSLPSLNMVGNANLISCNFSSFPRASLTPSSQRKPHVHLYKPLPLSLSLKHQPKLRCSSTRTDHLILPQYSKTAYSHQLQLCQCSLETQNVQSQLAEKEDEEKEGGGDNNGGEERDWTTSILLFVFWGGLMYYVFFLAPNQTPSMDMYLLQKLLNLKGDDGFQLNQVIVALWYIMGLWPLVYSMLLLPTGRSSKSSVPVWPFVVLSCFGGAYALIPYFVLWKPPPPPVEEGELRRWPLNFLESKLTAGITLAAGVILVGYAGLSNGDLWKEFFQYFGGSKFIHLTSVDFCLLSAFAPFWVYNDMTARKWYEKGYLLLPLSLIPFLGPALYLLLRPSLSEITPATADEK